MGLAIDALKTRLSCPAQICSIFVDEFNLPWSIVAHNNDPRFISKASFFDTIRAQLGGTTDLVAVRPRDLGTAKGLN